MGVVESRHDEMSAEIDDLGLRPFQFFDVEGLADGLNAVVADRDRFFALYRTELAYSRERRCKRWRE